MRIKFLKGLFIVLLFTIAAVSLYVTVFNKFIWYISIPLSAILPIVAFSIFMVSLDFIYYLKDAVSYMKSKEKENRKENEEFRNWFRERHNDQYYNYPFQYRSIAKNKYMIEKLEEDKKLRIEQFKKTQEEERKLKLKIEEKLEGEG